MESHGPTLGYGAQDQVLPLRAAKPASGSFSKEELAATKASVSAGLENLWRWLKADAEQRAA